MSRIRPITITAAALALAAPAAASADVLAPADESLVTGMALSRRALSFSVDAFTHELGESRLYVKSAGAAAREVAHSGFGEENRREHLSPSIAGRYVYWAFSNHSDLSPANGWVARCDLLTGRTTAALAPGYLDAVAADATRRSAPLLVSSFSQHTNKVKGTNQIATLDAPSWGILPAELRLTRGGPCNR